MLKNVEKRDCLIHVHVAVVKPSEGVACLKQKPYNVSHWREEGVVVPRDQHAGLKKKKKKKKERRVQIERKANISHFKACAWIGQKQALLVHL